jgi:group I intron endonuclease
MQSGIYKITNIINGKFYIGSSVNLNHRKWRHFNLLDNNKHVNKKLQNSYNKYGQNAFIFEILAKCPKEYLIKLEQWFLDKQNPSFNICKFAGNTLGQKMKTHVKEALKKSKENYIISEETRKKMSERLKNRKRNKETYEKAKNTKIERYGKKMISEEGLEKLKNKVSKTKGKKLEDVFGKDKANEIKSKKSKSRIGYKHTEETKHKMQKSALKRAIFLKGKTLEEIYGIEKSKIIKEKLSTSSKSEKSKIGRIKSAKKLKGKKQSIEHINKRANSKSRPIKVTNLIDNSFKIYKGIKEFSKISGISETQIINVLKIDGLMKYKKLKIEKVK